MLQESRQTTKTISGVRKILLEELPMLATSALLGLFASIAYEFLDGTPDWSVSIFLILRAFLLAIAIFMAFVLARHLFKLANNQEVLVSPIHQIEATLFNPKISFSVQVVFLAGVMLICWLPYYIALFPGNMYNDTAGQLAMFFSFANGDGAIGLGNHHPIFDTMVFGTIVYGVALLAGGNFQVGVGVCVFLQMVATAGSFSIALTVARRRWGCSLHILLGSLCFLALFPLIPVIVVNLSKDTFFSWLYVLFFLWISDAVHCRFENTSKLRPLTAICIIAMLLCLTKQIAVYIVIGTFLMLALFAGGRFKSRTKLLLPALLSVVLMFGIVSPLLRMANIRGGGFQEALSLPFQQTALSYIRHGSEMPQDELSVLSKVLELDTIKNKYVITDVDGIKGYEPRGTTGDYIGYLRVYLFQGLRYPDSYCDALLAMESPFFNATGVSLLFNSDWHIADGGYFPDSYYDKGEFGTRASAVVEAFCVWAQSVPLVNVLFTSGFYVIYIPAFALALLLSRRGHRRQAIILIPVAVSIVGLFLSPITGYHGETTRYLLPFIYTAPIIIAFASLSVREGQGNNGAGD